MKPLHLLLFILLIAPAWADPSPAAGESGLVAHEWGTFTTVSGGSGAALDWRPLAGPSDLPSFVHTNRQKSGWRGQVRMETPVIYFYTDRERTVRAKVSFTKGQITEWYPWAKLYSGGEGGVDWGGFKLIPPTAPEARELKLLHEGTPSHYYPAREVDAAFVRSCGVSLREGEARAEAERFLFYRGVGNVSLPFEVKAFDDGELLVRNTGKHAVQQAIVFERDGDRVRLASLGQLAAGHSRNVRPGRLSTVTQESVEGVLLETLTASGLYAKEAQAMLATWRDHWFEEGVRVFYVVPRAVTDRVLPLTLDPQPQELVRTIVGRVEVITPAYSRKLLHLAKRWEASEDRALWKELRNQGRFAEPALTQLAETGKLSAETVAKLTD